MGTWGMSTRTVRLRTLIHLYCGQRSEDGEAGRGDLDVTWLEAPDVGSRGTGTVPVLVQ